MGAKKKGKKKSIPISIASTINENVDELINLVRKPTTKENQNGIAPLIDPE